jgi:YhcN/YlaJ family sporulation lipoprotein
MRPFVVFLIISSALLLTGCQMNNEAENNNNNNEEIVYVKDPAHQENQNRTGQETAERLVEIAISVPTVNDATAVVAGRYAVVGIDVDAELERSRVESIKYTVAESLKHDPFGANSVVVADADTVARIEEISERVGEGEPVEGFMDELAAIIGRVMPELPQHTETKENPTEENEQQLSPNEEQQLDETQKDQSKNHLNN